MAKQRLCRFVSKFEKELDAYDAVKLLEDYGYQFESYDHYEIGNYFMYHYPRAKLVFLHQFMRDEYTHEIIGDNMVGAFRLREDPAEMDYSWLMASRSDKQEEP